jgi:magnesium-transporting ATPase (P-type)
MKTKIDLDYFVKGEFKDLFIEALISNCSASLRPSESGSKTEICLLKFIEMAGWNYETLKESYNVDKKFPFSSLRK